MKKNLRVFLGLMIVASLLLFASPASAASYGESYGDGDFYADDTGSVTPGGKAHFTFVAKIKDKKGPLARWGSDIRLII